MYRYYKVKNLPEILYNYSVSNNENIDIRNAFRLHKSYKRTLFTNYPQHSLANKGTEIWNSLAKELKQIKSHCFVRKSESI